MDSVLVEMEKDGQKTNGAMKRETDEVRYSVCIQMLESSEGQYTAYGIRAADGQGRELRRVDDITCDRAALEELVLLCNRLSLSLCHLNDVIEDFLT